MQQCIEGTGTTSSFEDTNLFEEDKRQSIATTPTSMKKLETRKRVSNT